ncbi:MAG TPA: hypothetical protein VK879_14390 [Candidatus Sulfomarinibacteraceae bacterium]|nr:hypothetical protein [Candidatus Sulfomarinibacteraceae bacterium]
MTATDRRPLGVVSIGVPWFGIETATRHLNETRAMLAEHYALAGPEAVVTDAGALEEAIDSLRQANVDALLLQVATFPDGEAPARLAQALNVPIIVHSLPEPALDREISLNSLCGANMITYTLTALEAPHTFAHGDPADESVQRALLARIRAAMALGELRRTRVGLIGFRAPGFYPCAFDELLLRRELGVAIDHVGLNELSRELESGARRDAPREKFPLIEGGELPAEGVARMERFYGALTNVVRESGHQVIAIKDWPEFFDADVVGGFWPVLGWIQEDGVVLAPEGDVNGAVTMALQRALTETIPTLVDVSAWDDEGSTLTLWHYGGAESLARDPGEIRYGAYGREVEYTFAQGRATLARIGLYGGQLRLLTIAVELLDERVTLRRAAGLARTVNTPAGEVVHRLLDDGWEHHPCLVYGDLGDEFAAFAKLSGLSYTAL